VLFRNLTKVAPDIVKPYTLDVLNQAAAARPDVIPYPDAEVAIAMFYLLGEGLRGAPRETWRDREREVVGFYRGECG
jgi:hypothetical protein